MKAPTTRRKFRLEWDEIVYLGTKLEYWLHHGGNRSNARRYVRRLRSLLDRHDEGAIVAQECRSLIEEYSGNTRGAIQHTNRQLALIRRLHSLRDLPRHARFPRERVLKAERRLRSLRRRLRTLGSRHG